MINKFSDMLNSHDCPTLDQRKPLVTRSEDEAMTRSGDGYGLEGCNDLARHPILSPENYTEFCKLVDDVGLLKISAEATATIKFGNLGIRNFQECTRWVRANYADARYGLLIDPLTLLDRLFGDDKVNPITHLKTMESMSKLNIETGAESSALTSLKYPRPRMFHKG